MHLKMLSAKWQQFCLGLYVLDNDFAPNKHQTITPLLESMLIYC